MRNLVKVIISVFMVSLPNPDSPFWAAPLLPSVDMFGYRFATAQDLKDRANVTMFCSDTLLDLLAVGTEEAVGLFVRSDNIRRFSPSANN